MTKTPSKWRRRRPSWVGTFKPIATTWRPSFALFGTRSRSATTRSCRRASHGTITAARTFIQKVYDAGFIRKDKFEGWYCEGCEAFKTEKDVKEANGACPLHPTTPVIRRSEPCYYFELSKFQDRLLKHYEEHPEFIQPESRRNEIVELIRTEGLKDVNITRLGETWGIRVPWDEQFTIYVWFDALLTYITGIGYGSDEAKFRKWWPAECHFIGKDITRFHCALWPAMLWAAGEEPPRMVFGHGFVYKKNEETGAVERFSKSLGNVIEPMDIVTKFSAEAFRYYFLRECPFPADGEFSWQRFAEVYNGDLANNLGNLSEPLYYASVLEKLRRSLGEHWRLESRFGANICSGRRRLHRLFRVFVGQWNRTVSISQFCPSCRNSAIRQTNIWRNGHLGNWRNRADPWSGQWQKGVVRAIQCLRVASILLKPFVPSSAGAVYASFNFPTPWQTVTYADAADPVHGRRSAGTRRVGWRQSKAAFPADRMNSFSCDAEALRSGERRYLDRAPAPTKA